MEVAQSSGPPPWRRVWLTSALSLVPVVGTYVPMPGIDFASLPEKMASSPNTSLFMLGVSPLLSGYLLVELAALLVPRLRKLRHGFPDGRARLRRWAFITALVLAAFQSFGVATVLRSGALGGDVNTVLLVLSATAATGVLVLAARAIDGLGLVNGIVALSLAREFGDAPRDWGGATLPHEPRSIAIMVALYALPLLATWAALRRFEQGAARGTAWLGGPLSTLRPVVATASLLTLPAMLRPFPGAEALAALIPGPRYFDIFLGTGIAFTLLLSFFLQQPKRVARVLNAVEQPDVPFTTDDVWQSLRAALLPTLLLIVTLLLSSALLRGNGWPDYAFTLALLTGLLLDGARAFKLHSALPGLVRVWEERRPYAVPGLVGAAEDVGISLRISGVAQTSMLRLFGSFAAIGLWCTPTEAAAARELLGELLLCANGTLPVAPTSPATSEDANANADADEDEPDAKG